MWGLSENRKGSTCYWNQSSTSAGAEMPMICSAEFGDKILELVDDPVRRDRMGAFGQKKIRDELAWDHEAVNLLRAYEKAFSLRHSPRRQRGTDVLELRRRDS